MLNNRNYKFDIVGHHERLRRRAVLAIGRWRTATPSRAAPIATAQQYMLAPLSLGVSTAPVRGDPARHD